MENVLCLGALLPAPASGLLPPATCLALFAKEFFGYVCAYDKEHPNFLPGAGHAPRLLRRRLRRSTNNARGLLPHR